MKQKLRSPEGNSRAEAKFFENKVVGGSFFEFDELMTTKEVAVFLKTTEKSVLNMASNGKIPVHKFYRRNFYIKRELLSLFSPARGVK